MRDTVVFEFRLGIRCHLDVWQSVDDVDGNNVPVYCHNALLASLHLERLVIHGVASPLQLSGRMDGGALSQVSVLLKDEDDGSFVGHDSCGGINNLEMGQFMVINSSDIDPPHMLKRNNGVRSKNSSIGTSIDQGSPFSPEIGIGNMVGYLMRVYLVASCRPRHHRCGLA